MRKKSIIRRALCAGIAAAVSLSLTGCLDVFDKIDDYIPDDGTTSSSQPTENTTPDPTQTSPSSPSESTEPIETTAPTEPVVFDPYWVIITGDSLNIRSGPGTDNDHVGTLKKGDRVEILEHASANGSTWGRTVDGWISLNFTSPETTDPEDPSDNAVSGTVTAKVLNVREGTGTKYDVVTTYGKGDTIKILEQKTVDGVLWGRTEDGWVSMKYVSVSAESPVEDDPVQETEMYGTVTAKTLNVRIGPGTNYDVVATLQKGDKVRIYSTETVNGRVWAEILSGWVSMEYLKTTGELPTQTEPEEPVAQIDASILGSWVHTTETVEAEGGDQYVRAGILTFTSNGVFTHSVDSYVKFASTENPTWVCPGSEAGGTDSLLWKGTFTFDGTVLVLHYTTEVTEVYDYSLGYPQYIGTSNASIDHSVALNVTWLSGKGEFSVDDPDAIPLYSDLGSGEDSPLTTVYKASESSQKGVYVILNSIYP